MVNTTFFTLFLAVMVFKFTTARSEMMLQRQDKEDPSTRQSIFGMLDGYTRKTKKVKKTKDPKVKKTKAPKSTKGPKMLRDLKKNKDPNSTKGPKVKKTKAPKKTKGPKKL